MVDAVDSVTQMLRAEYSNAKSVTDNFLDQLDGVDSKPSSESVMNMLASERKVSVLADIRSELSDINKKALGSS